VRILIAAGGTGGHLFPALAVLEELQELGQVEAWFVGRADRIEGRVVPALGYSLQAIPMRGFPGWRSPQVLRLPIALAQSLWLVRQRVQEFRPHVVLATGAYSSLPVGIVARWYGIPLVLLELNVRPGRAVRLLARWATAIITAMEPTALHLPRRARDRVQCWGAPVRRALRQVSTPSEARRLLGLSPELPTVAILGGSLGSARLNRVAQRLLPHAEAGRMQLLWQHGAGFTPPPGLPRTVLARPFFAAELAAFYAAADCVVARAGAMTIAELCAVGRAAILVPYPAAAEQHQWHNARWMESHGAAICIADEHAEAEVPAQVEALLAEPERRHRLAEAARRLSRPDAAARIAQLLWQLGTDLLSGARA
jgi:UDP-N-acetylglucosamine--N-acetylmuramyl-(pentapeptide) pyrophosphoryl-undecaprenol N-acetylglucosamine transferase